MATQRVTFTTTDGQALSEERFAAYHDLYAPVADVLKLGRDFAVSVDAHRIGTFLAFDRKLKGVAHSRSAKRVARDAFDHFTIQLALRGSFQVSTDSGDRIVDQGALALIDMTRRMRTDTHDTNLLTLSIPRERIEALSHDAGRLHGAVLPAPRVALLRDFITSFLSHQSELSASDRAAAERIMTELLELALAGRSLDDRAMPEAASDVVCRTRAKRFIDSNLGCTPEDVARALGRSRSVLYRAFQPLGGLSSYIQGRRLARLRGLLVEPGESRQIAELAAVCGFASATHCARAFKSRFDLSPSDYRAARASAFGAAAEDGAHKVLAQWWGDLR